MTSPITQRPLNVQAGQSLERQALGFMAYSAVIDNPTGQWYYIPAVNRYISPYALGIQIVFPSGTQSADLRASNPPGATSNPLTGQFLYATYTADRIAPNPGQPTNSNALVQAQELPTFITSRFFSIAPAIGDYYFNIFNPATSNLTARIRRLRIYHSPVIGAVANLTLQVSLRFTGSFGSGGVAFNPIATRFNDPGTVIGFQITIPAISAPTTLIDIGTYLIGHLGTAGFIWAIPGFVPFDLYPHIPGQYTRPITLEPGQGIGLRADSAGASGLNFGLDAQITTEPFLAPV